MTNTQARVGPLLGRILIAAVFLASGYVKLTAMAGTAAYVASKGLPMPEALTIAAGALEVLAGVMLVIGWQARWAAAALLAFTAMATLVFHAFWAVPPEQVQGQTVHFTKNLAIIGGLLYVMSCGAGPLSVQRD